MPMCQYRKGGGGDILLYRRYEIPNSVPIIGGLGFWKKVTNITSKKSAACSKVMDKMDDVVEVVREVERLTVEEKDILELIKKGVQDNCNHSDPMEMPIPKDSKKHRGRVGPPRDGWKRVVTFVRDWMGPSTPKDVMMRNATVSSSSKPDRVGVINQPVGDPVPMNRGKGGNSNQHQHNQDRW